MAAPPSLLDDGQPSSGSPLSIGQVVSGKYRIERQIGRGGMGIVLAATHLQLGNIVALKVMRRDLLPDDRALDRLLIEARAAARIRSEHVARVLDVGMLDNGSPFIVMEYLEGENLADLLDRQGALDIEQAASFLMQCCLALAEVHVADMIHRDLKPGNIFIAQHLDGSPTVKIVDFGISKYIGDAREHGAVTSPQVLGSPFYMSPEQMRAEKVDERSDIWGLGAILFETLTGRPPFLGDTLPEVYAAVLNHSPPQIDSLRPGVPPALDDVVQRCLEKDPSLRYCDVADLAEALAPFAGPMAAQAVERVKRILMNPDAARARYSLAPGMATGARLVGAEDAGVERLSMQPAVIVPIGAAGVMGEASMGAEREHGRGAASPGTVPATMLEQSEPRPVAAPREASWPPSPSNTGELSPLAATGARVRAARGGRGRGVLVAVAACATVILAAALFWPHSRPSGSGAVEAEPAAVPIERGAELPRVAPVASGAESTPARPSPAEVEGDGELPIVEARALRPLPPAKPVAPRAAPPPRSARTDPSSALWSAPGEPARAPEGAPSRAEAEAKRPEADVKRPAGETGAASSGEAPSPGAPRRPLATPDDAWNPDTFGERR